MCTSNGMIVIDSSPDDPVTRYLKSGKVYEAPSLKTHQGWPMEKSSPRKRQWDRTKRGVAKKNHMDKDKSELTSRRIVALLFLVLLQGLQ